MKTNFMPHQLSKSFSGALRTFSYFLASGKHYNLAGINYLDLYGKEPSAIEQVFAIFANVILLDEDDTVLNNEYAQERATNYLKQYCIKDYTVTPAYKDWEVAIH